MSDKTDQNPSSRDSANRNDNGAATDIKNALKALKSSSQISAGAAQKAIVNLKRQLGPALDIQEKMRKIQTETGPDTKLGKLAKQISDQQHRINEVLRPISSLNTRAISVRDLKRVPEQLNLPDIAPNPAYETNERLERIEERFKEMQDIATNAAQIATGLQAAAAEFLQKFERAADENSRATGRAIWIGIAAVMIAVTMPAAQIFYSEYRREANHTPAMHAALIEIQAEISAMRESQSAGTDRLAEVFSSSDGETAAILRGIHKLLLESTELEAVPRAERFQ
jgi:hypothetical protein